MKYAVISDIHSNFEALQVALDDIQKEKVDKILCCGDIVGYGPNPEECIEALRNIQGIEITMGNHDAAVAGKIDTADFNDYAITATEINKLLLTDENTRYLSMLKYQHKEQGILFVHGSPNDLVMEYMTTLKILRENIGRMKTPICVAGHTHLPMVYSVDNTGKEEILDIEGEEDVVLKDDVKYIINAGSVGQPRDRDNRSCFIYLDTDKKIVKFRRLKYDIGNVQEKMKNAGLPEYLITRLSYGK